MKVPISWLKEHLDTSASCDDICDALNACGLVIDGVHNPGASLHAFKIVKIIETVRHPQADRLQICTVDTGQEILQIVCAAPNARAGLVSVLGRSGDYVPGLNLTLKPATIRGVESLGMLCTLSELGLAAESSGIIELPENAPLGEAYVRYAGLDDPILDVDVTPNRGDCLSMRGIARDLQGKGLGVLKTFSYKTHTGTFDSPISLRYENTSDVPHACPYFTGRLIRGLKNGPSPDWLQKKLHSVGLNPISALVDITNYMTYHLGRPMHVFDADRLCGSLSLRFATENEAFQALDGQTYTLNTDMLVIADTKGPQSLAGIMGGLTSACQMDTTSVFLESAYFDPSTIARTGRAMGILSDSRYRFERDTDTAAVLMGLEYATQLIHELCGGEASCVVSLGEAPTKDICISFDKDYLKTFGGLDLPKNEIIELLENLGFICSGSDSTFKVYPPSWRSDITGPHDLLEEILRMKGYDQVPVVSLPKSTVAESFPTSSLIKTRRHRSWVARRALASRGFHEMVTWSFMKEKDAGVFADVSSNMILSNPISMDLSTMRPSILGNLAKCLQRNKDRGQLPKGVFEVGLEYHNTTLQGQRWVVASLRPGFGETRHWRIPHKGFSVYDLKADLWALLEAFHLDADAMQLVNDAPSYYHPRQSATLKMGPKNVLGYFGALHPNACQALDVTGPLYGFELFLEALPLPKGTSKAFEPSPYQPVERDLAFVVDDTVPASLLINTVKKCAPSLIKEVTIFDVYKGAGIPEGKKSIALYYRMEPSQKTLTDAEIHETMQAVITAVEQATKGSLRS